MSINSRVITALTGTIPVDFGMWTGGVPPAQYATFTVMSTPESSADDDTDCIGHYIYLTLWSSSNYVATLADIHAAMESAGFLWQEERAMYEADTKTYYVAMTWLYQEAI